MKNIKTILAADIVKIIEEFSPLSLQENYDNCGLIIGSLQQKVTGIILCLDSIEEIIDEAIAKKCNFVLAHHPIIFSGLKKINGKNYIEKTIIKAIKNNICIYACHTNLDNIAEGVNKKIAEKLNLKNCSILAPKTAQLQKIFFYSPPEFSEKIKNALFEIGVGKIGNYDNCSFTVSGIGSFRGNEYSNPTKGKKNKLEIYQEDKIELLFPNYLKNKVIDTLKKNHPYEEVAYEIVNLENEHQEIGAGMIGELEKEIDALTFLKTLKKKMNCAVIRHSEILPRKIKKVALCGGAGSFLLPSAISQGSDIYISGDFKYHEFFDANKNILIADIGHYESEQYTMEIFFALLSKKLPNFAIHFSMHNTNPVKYLL
ncbi:MAG: Nif3-like dinuclear metal center hexameric protein [Chitinophagaceae bacterium]|nr:Nif3-like dinuclear metal center hexameric protein [Chitinophagaceae bacterium]